MEPVTMGNFALSALLTLAVGVFYQFFQKADGTSTISDPWKTRIVILTGMGLGILALFYNSIPLTTSNIVTYVVSGLQTGLASIGIWKGLGVVNTVGTNASVKITAATPPVA
jgi:hypothetical protein